MRQMLMMKVSSLLVVLGMLGCGATTERATQIIYDAKVRIGAAKQADAQNLAPRELAEAEQMVVRSEEMLSVGKETEAYRMGMRAQLTARIAEALALANQLEAKANSSEATLESQLDAAEAANRDLQQAEWELQELQSTPEE